MASSVVVPNDARRDVLARTFSDARELDTVLPCKALVAFFEVDAGLCTDAPQIRSLLRRRKGHPDSAATFFRHTLPGARRRPAHWLVCSSSPPLPAMQSVAADVPAAIPLLCAGVDAKVRPCWTGARSLHGICR